jgi:hypothetical protein
MKRWGRGCSIECSGLGGADASPCQGDLVFWAIRLPINSVPRRADRSFIHGSSRQRNIGSYELRVFTGTDPASGNGATSQH